MQRIQPGLISILAFVVSLASVSCACASAVPEHLNAPDAHVSHHDHGAPANTDCVDSGCGGSGGFTAVVPERVPSVDDVLDTSADDDNDATPVVAMAAPPFEGRFVHRPPPLDLPRFAAATPVTRFDRLLN